MSCVVIRGLLVLAIVVALVGLVPGTTSAGADLGQFCFNLAPLVDTLRLSLAVTDGPAAIIAVNFRLRFASSAQIGGTGTLTESLLSPGSFDLALNGTHNTAFFGGHKVCALFAVLTPPGFSGPWQYTCTGAGGAAFTNSGTLNPVECTAAM